MELYPVSIFSLKPLELPTNVGLSMVSYVMRVSSRWNLAVRHFAPISLFVIGLTACEKDQLDEEVRRLCEKDGGIRIHRTVEIPAAHVGRDGDVDLLDKRYARPTDEYFYTWEVQTIKEGNPSLKRHHYRIIRRSDGEVLAEGIGYARRGGDLPGPWHESAFQCPSPDEYSVKTASRKVFVVTQREGIR